MVIKHLVGKFNHGKIKFTSFKILLADSKVFKSHDLNVKIDSGLFLNLMGCFVIFVIPLGLLFSGIVAYIYNVCC